jgi:hypothetical protein
MSSLDILPNDPELFSKLVDGMTSLNGSSRTFFNIDDARYSYPNAPDNIRQMEDTVFTATDADGRIADGKAMASNSLEPDNVERRIYSYLFDEEARPRYGRIGEFITSCLLETAERQSLQIDLYWVESNGTVWTRTEERLGKNYMTAEEKRRATRRQLTDFELEAVGQIIRGTIPRW